MHEFSYRGGRLCAESVPLEDLARRFGTPLYVYSHATLTGHFERLDRAFAGVPHLICYSVKSCANLAVLKTLANAGAGFDIVSGGELRRALATGVGPEKIVFAGVGKTEEEIAAALRRRILFLTVESLAELETIERVAARLRLVARIAFRVTPDVDPHTHRYITTGKAENKFGLDLARAREAYRKAMRLRHVRPTALQMHIGSQIVETGPYVEALRKVLPLARVLLRDGVPLERLDIGGGLGIIYRDETPATADRFAAAVLPELEGLGLKLVLEPGRFIAGNSGVLLTRVLYRKKGGARDFVIVDAAMNDLIRPSLYGAYHEILPLRKGKGRTITADVVGPVCESGDFLAKDRRMREPRPGDLLAVMGAGAYGFAMSSNYNSRRRAAEVLARGARAWLVRKRERYEDLVRGERIPAFLEK
ncbi:MAG TPA: diaminopimelate decarboxylase [bacterium]|nr:diaminopimelate decarboxylase [Chlamydiota bacterium]HOE26212.1 diaminopimelate decarboxylase [bacterium]HQM52031.1 diaminopimelate decarboxylase [bacterium]